MANDTPHVPDAQKPAVSLAVSARESERPPVPAPERSVPIPEGRNPNHVSADPVHAGPANANPAQANPLQANPTEAPPPSRSNAAWLAITLLNIVLIVFLLPASLLKNEQVAFIIKVGTLVGAAGAFAAGLMWFKKLATSLPKQKLFKVLNIVALCGLIPAHLSQMQVVPVHPKIEPTGTKLEIDGQPRDYENGTVRMSIGNHSVKVSPSGGGQARDFTVSYKDVFFAIFKDYRPRWTPLYQVTIDTNSENVEVTIQKKDGEFDVAFRKSPPTTELKLTFEPNADAKDLFIYRGADNPNGSADHVELPYGEYEFTARRNDCKERDVKILKIGNGQTEKYSVEFKPLCETGP